MTNNGSNQMSEYTRDAFADGEADMPEREYVIECFACGVEIPQDKNMPEEYRTAEQPPIVFCEDCKNIEEHLDHFHRWVQWII